MVRIMLGITLRDTKNNNWIKEADLSDGHNRDHQEGQTEMGGRVDIFFRGTH